MIKFIFKKNTAKILRDTKGFSFLEAMIVISIIVIGILGINSLMVQNLRVQGINQYNLVASMLAQEGLEMVRNIRDENWVDISLGLMTIDNWANSIADADGIGSFNTDGTYVIDYTNTNEKNNPPNDVPDSITDTETILYYQSNGFIGHIPSARPTIYRRLITADYDHDGDPNTNDIKVTCTVRWSARGMTRDYVAETYFYDWR